MGGLHEDRDAAVVEGEDAEDSDGRLLRPEREGVVKYGKEGLGWVLGQLCKVNG